MCVEQSEEEIKRAVSHLKAMLWLFKYICRKDFKQQFIKLLQMLSTGQCSSELLIRMCCYIGASQKFDEKELIEIVEEYTKYDIGEELMGTLQTMVLDAREEGIKIGKQEGKQEGIKIGEEKGIKIGKQVGKQEGIKIGEEKGIKIGKQEAIIEILQERFGNVPENIINSLRAIDDISRLRFLVIRASTIEDIKAFSQILSLSEKSENS